MQPQIQHMAGLALIVAGVALVFWCLGRLSKTFKLRYLVLPLPVMVLGIALIEWRVLWVFASLAACLGLFAYASHVRERSYARDFPVFGAAPVGSVIRRDGFKHDLYITGTQAGFIIGIRCETEVDQNPATVHTRWKDVFPDYASARQALLKRLSERIPADQMPGVDMEDALPRHPAQAAHVPQ